MKDDIDLVGFYVGGDYFSKSCKQFHQLKHMLWQIRIGFV